MSQETSTSGQDASTAVVPKKALSWNERIEIIKPTIKVEWVAILDHYGFAGMEPLFDLIRENRGFHSIIFAQPPSVLPRHTVIFYYILRAMMIDSNAVPKKYDPTTTEFRMPITGIPDEYIHNLPLILRTYGLRDEGEICWIDNVLVDEVHTAYKEVVVKPKESFDLKTFNRRLLKPEYKILFNFVHKVFMAFSGTHDSMMLPKFKCITDIVHKLDVNWARVLASLLVEEATQIS